MLRDVVETDIPIFFEHQREPEANVMALFPARDEDAFNAHWRRLLANENLVKKTIVDNGAVAGNILCFERDGRHEVGYWIGRDFWGKGLATTALAQLLDAEAGGLTALELSRRLLEQKVAATPMTGWGGEVANRYVRLVFSNEPVERLELVGQRVRAALGSDRT